MDGASLTDSGMAFQMIIVVFTKVCWMARRHSSDFEGDPGTDWELMKLIHDVLDRRSE